MPPVVEEERKMRGRQETAARAGAVDPHGARFVAARGIPVSGLSRFRSTMGSRMGMPPERYRVVSGPGMGGMTLGQEIPLPGSGVAPDAPPEVIRQANQSHGRRLAWGTLKKLEAEELAAQLAVAESKMRAMGIPAGIVASIRDRLLAFVESAPEGAEIELTEEDLDELDSALLAIEAEEKSRTAKASTLAVFGVVTVVALVFLT